MNDMKSKLKGMTLLSLLSLGGCVSMEKAPPVPTLTLAELRTEINLSEQRLQTSMEQQQKQYVQQQHLLVQLNTDVTNMKESVKKVDSKLATLPPEPPKPMAIPTEKCPAPSQGHTVDGKPRALPEGATNVPASFFNPERLDTDQWMEAVKALGADVVIDYKQQAFETVLRDYDVVLHSLGKDELEKSLQVLKPGGQLISISGPPTADMADQLRLSWPIRQVLRLLSHGIRTKARQRGIRYAFLFMTANGGQLRDITALIEAGAIKPVVDRVFPLDAAADALAYVATGRAKGKVVITVP